MSFVNSDRQTCLTKKEACLRNGWDQKIFYLQASDLEKKLLKVNYQLKWKIGVIKEAETAKNDCYIIVL